MHQRLRLPIRHHLRHCPRTDPTHDHDNNFPAHAEPQLGQLDPILWWPDAPPTPHFYSFINRIWALLATGANNFSITNVVIGNRLIADLNLTHHTKAIKVLKALVNQITLHQSQGTPILVQASVATKYHPFAATYHIFPKPNTPDTNPPDTTT